MNRILIFLLIIIFPTFAFGMDTPSVTATAKGPNQINLTWSQPTNPGWGYKVEMQSDGDSRYSAWTELPITRGGRNYLPYWVTEAHYTDIIDGSGSSMGSAAQFQMYGLVYGTLYNFRVRCYGKTDAGVETYGSYSSTASATTITPSTIRYVVVGGAGSQNGTSWGNAWAKMSSAAGVAAGTLVLVRTGNYAADNVAPTTSGTQANHTVFQAEPVSGTTVTITSVTGGTPSIYLNHSYIVVDGIGVDNSDADNQRVVVSGSRNAVVNSDLDANNAGYGEVINCSGSYNLFHYNAIHDGDINDQEGGFTMTIYGAGADRNVVQYNHIYRGGHDTGLIQNGADYNQWKNNQQDGGYGLAWECVASSSPAPTYNLYEGNIAMHQGDNQPGVYKPTIEVSGTYTTVRRNILLHGSSHGIELSALHAISANHNLIYNNVIYANGQLGQIMFGSPRANNVMTNNIYYANVGDPGGDWGDNLEVGILDTTGAELFNNNVILRHHGGADYPNEISCARIAATNNTANANTAWSEFDNNITTNPGYINEAGYEFHLLSTSGIRGTAIAVTDTQWGTVVNAGDEIGAFKYFAISGETPPAVPSLKGVTIIGGTVK
jgi:hypothetical protein